MCSSLLINFCHNNFWFTVMPSISLKSVHQEKHWPVHSCPVSIPQKGTGPETEAKICPHFYDRNSPRGIMCFCKNFEHLSKVTKRWFIIKSLWEQNGKEIDENHFQGSQEGKKKTVLLMIALREDVLVLPCFQGGNKQEGKKLRLSSSKSTSHLSFSGLCTNEGILVASSFLPPPK